MGDYLHRAIVVTGYCNEDCTEKDNLLKKAHKKASSSKLFGFMVSPIVSGYANGFHTFTVVPCGLKTSTQKGAIECEQTFVNWLKKQVEGHKEPKRCELDWVWVQYGDEVKGRSVVLDSSDMTNDELEKEFELLGDG